MNFLDWFYPKKCISCQNLQRFTKKTPTWICDNCETLFEPIEDPTCQTCGAPTETPIQKCASCHGKKFHFSQNKALFLYDDLIRNIIHDIKFRNKINAAHGLGQLWAKLMKEVPTATLVPLPMHKKKQRERGFNQAEILAIELSKALGVSTESVLVRTVDTPPQAGLHPSIRAENVDGVFEISPNCNPVNKSYILIDDIYTTGASLNECAKTLKNAGAKEISCMTLAISVKNISRV